MKYYNLFNIAPFLQSAGTALPSPGDGKAVLALGGLGMLHSEGNLTAVSADFWKDGN